MTQLFQRNLSAGVARLVERHWTHTQLGNAACTAVQDTLVVRGGRAGQNKLALFGGLIYLVAHRVPERRNLLPFVDQARSLAG